MVIQKDGRRELYQHDTGRSLIIESEKNIIAAEFQKNGRLITVEAKNDKVMIPDILLKDTIPFTVFLKMQDADGIAISSCYVFHIIPH